MSITSIFDGVFCILAAKWWDGLSALALIATLVYLIKYTRATERMAKVQEEEIGLNKRPVVSIICAFPSEFNFTPGFLNLSLVHAKLRVQAQVIVNKQTLVLYEGHHYSGVPIWHLQAMGSNAQPFTGHLNLDGVFQHNKLTFHPNFGGNATVIIRAWVINYWDDESLLLDNKNLNPDVKWNWDPKSQFWNADVAPNGRESQSGTHLRSSEGWQDINLP